MSRLDLWPLGLQPQLRGLRLRPGAPEEVPCGRPSVQLRAQHQFRCKQADVVINEIFSHHANLLESIGVSNLKIESCLGGQRGSVKFCWISKVLSLSLEVGIAGLLLVRIPRCFGR